MKPDDINLGAVNWEHGMLLTPEHFLRLERYFDSNLLWILRYATNAYGLIGGGARMEASERGAVRFDPIVAVDEDDQTIDVSVTQCRGLTPGGGIVDIDPEHPVWQRFSKAGLEGVAELPIYIICEPHKKDAVDGPVDEFNPQMKTERRPCYQVSLWAPPDQAAHVMAVGRLRRHPHGAGYEKDPDYIPACASMVGCSQLAASWRGLVEEATRLTRRYTELYRSMQEYLRLFKERGIETELDFETASFVNRMAVALQDCAWEVLDPTQSPQAFFGRLRRFFYNAAAYLDLSPSTLQYFTALRDVGETEFIPLLEQQKRTLEINPRWQVNDDLAVEVREAAAALNGLSRLEQALEGKYVDFRLCPSLEAMNFIFDRGGQVLYRLAAKPARVQGSADELLFTFGQLRLEGRDKYRLILAGEQGASFEKGVQVTAEIRINEGSAHKGQPVLVTSEAKYQGQRNFEFDFDAPDVPTIMDVRVSIQAYHPIRSALLFVRHRFYAASQERPTARPLQPEPAMREAVPGAPTRERLVEAAPVSAKPAPWELPKGDDRPVDAGQAPPRRRRLE
ncbi:MAG: hypothetical protein WAO35_28610 [Terriglobia bacterium]